MANEDFTWTREGLAWAAGLFEGEGCISVRRGRWDQWMLVLGSTDEDVIQRLQRVTGLGNINGPQIRGDHKPVWYWRVSKREHVYALLAALYPWLCQRRQERAREAILDMNQAKTWASRKCDNGHPWSPDTVRRQRLDGGRSVRVCRQCGSERSAV